MLFGLFALSLVAAFSRSFLATFSLSSSVTAACASSAARLPVGVIVIWLVRAVRAGTDLGGSLMPALRSMQGETLGGLLPPQTYGPGNHPEGSCGKILRWDGTRWQVITPEFVCG